MQIFRTAAFAFVALATVLEISLKSIVDTATERPAA
jgi:hypothetical protein